MLFPRPVSFTRSAGVVLLDDTEKQMRDLDAEDCERASDGTDESRRWRRVALGGAVLLCLGLGAGVLLMNNAQDATLPQLSLETLPSYFGLSAGSPLHPNVLISAIMQSLRAPPSSSEASPRSPSASTSDSARGPEYIIDSARMRPVLVDSLSSGSGSLSDVELALESTWAVPTELTSRSPTSAWADPHGSLQFSCMYRDAGWRWVQEVRGEWTGVVLTGSAGTDADREEAKGHVLGQVRCPLPTWVAPIYPLFDETEDERHEGVPAEAGSVDLARGLRHLEAAAADLAREMEYIEVDLRVWQDVGHSSTQSARAVNHTDDRSIPLRPNTLPGRSWSSRTPIILAGYDDDGLIHEDERDDPLADNPLSAASAMVAGDVVRVDGKKLMLLAHNFMPAGTFGTSASAAAARA